MFLWVAFFFFFSVFVLDEGSFLQLSGTASPHIAPGLWVDNNRCPKVQPSGYTRPAGLGGGGTGLG
jgi:hypothetical protein